MKSLKDICIKNISTTLSEASILDLDSTMELGDVIGLFKTAYDSLDKLYKKYSSKYDESKIKDKDTTIKYRIYVDELNLSFVQNKILELIQFNNSIHYAWWFEVSKRQSYYSGKSYRYGEPCFKIYYSHKNPKSRSREAIGSFICNDLNDFIQRLFPNDKDSLEKAKLLLEEIIKISKKKG